jgi:hypothetical protein
MGWSAPAPPWITRSPLTKWFESELGSNQHLLTKGSEGFSNKFFVCERTINFSGIEKRESQRQQIDAEGLLDQIFKPKPPKGKSEGQPS